MTRVGVTIVLAGLAVAGLSACQQAAAPDPQADVDAIKAVEDAMRAAYQAKDAAKIAANYAPDATLYVEGERPRVGTEALTAGATKDMADPAFNITFTTAKARAAGDMGYTQGSFTIRYTDPATKAAVARSGYYLTVFRRQADGSWKAVEDMSQFAG